MISEISRDTENMSKFRFASQEYIFYFKNIKIENSILLNKCSLGKHKTLISDY